MPDERVEMQRLLWARMEAGSHEAALPPVRRKSLGQFFTGIPLARLLAALSLRRGCQCAIDPMAGTGDLLDAVIERSRRGGLDFRQADGVEVCERTAAICRERLSAWQEAMPALSCSVHTASAFAPETIDGLALGTYDLVITNPPYVRYQTVSRNGRGGDTGSSPDTVRSELLRAVEQLPFGEERPIWRALASGYSGLADLSVPSWILGAMLVRPGGTLALVAPATWRSRDYADVLLYLLARFFRLNAVVADRRRGWFSGALVRTQLVVATRLNPEDAFEPLAQRVTPAAAVQWAEIAPEAQGGDSLVGGAFPSDDPERDFADWLFSDGNDDPPPKGMSCERRLLADEVALALARCSRSCWLPRVEPLAGDLPLFSGQAANHECVLPQVLVPVLGFGAERVCRLEALGIRVSQGLRTGCNDFFYVDFVEDIDQDTSRVCLSRLFGREYLAVPSKALVPVLRRQSDLRTYDEGLLPAGRILDLREWVLPEDYPLIDQFRPVYTRLQRTLPSAMPEGLALHVRRAAATRNGSSDDSGLIPELTAVRTNVCSPTSCNGSHVPRFWYMLPDFARRHVPDVFLARVNQQTPLALPNRADPLVVDANFSTLWAADKRWTPTAIAALLRGTWARACMEAVGTPMGGGALKLEATHIKRLPVPVLADQDIRSLADPAAHNSTRHIDDIVIRALAGPLATERMVRQAAERLKTFIDDAQLARQRG